MATIAASIEKALFLYTSAISLTPSRPIAWPNEDFTKPPGPYLRVTHSPNANDRLLIGSNEPHRRFGLLQVDSFMPKSGLSGPAAEIAGQIAEYFSTDLYLRSGNVAVRIYKAPEIGPSFADDTHWQTPVTVSYEVFA